MAVVLLKSKTLVESDEEGAADGEAREAREDVEKSIGTLVLRGI